MRFATVFVVAACGAKDPPKPHQLHRIDTPDGRTTITGTAVPLASLSVMDWAGLPMSGDIDVAIAVHRNGGDLRRATGTIAIACRANCRLGDDQAKLNPPGNAYTEFFGDGISFGHIDFDRFDIAVTLADGKATITKWDVVSKDVELRVDGTLQLDRTVGDSVIDACVRFRPTPALEQRDPKTAALLTTIGAERADDGMYNIKLADRVAHMKRLGRVCDGSQPEPLVTDPTLSAEPPAVPDGRDSDAAEAPALPDDTIDPKTSALIASAVKKRSSTSYDVDLAKWEQLLADPIALAKGVRIVPAIKNGAPDGFKLYAIRPGSLPAHLGLENGDTVMTLADRPLSNPDKALEIYMAIREMKAGDSVRLTGQRKGAPLTLTYTLR